MNIIHTQAKNWGWITVDAGRLYGYRSSNGLSERDYIKITCHSGNCYPHKMVYKYSHNTRLLSKLLDGEFVTILIYRVDMPEIFGLIQFSEITWWIMKDSALFFCWPIKTWCNFRLTTPEFSATFWWLMKTRGNIRFCLFMKPGN